MFLHLSLIATVGIVARLELYYPYFTKEKIKAFREFKEIGLGCWIWTKLESRTTFFLCKAGCTYVVWSLW